MGKDTRHIVHFGNFELDTDTIELRKRGRRIHLQDQPAQVLMALLDKPGDMVTREELQERLWPGGTYADADNSLNGAIRKLRDALGDSADAPRFIETMPRKGYRFIAPVERFIAGRPTQRRTERRVRLFASVAIAVVILVAATVVVKQRAQRDYQGRHKLAVLPFDDLGPDTGHGYLGDGLTEDIITELARLDGDHLGVIARNTSVSYKDTDKSIEQIGRELDVDYVLEGSVRKEDDNLRVTTQLIRVSDHTHLWAHTYDADFDQVLNMQKDIASRVSAALGHVLLPQAASAAALSTNAEAVDAFWKGRFHWHEGSEAGLHASVDFYGEAIAADGEFARAYAGLADTYNYLGMYGYGPPAETYERARASAKRALELDPFLAAAHAALGFTALYDDWDWDAAGASFTRALELEPGRAIVNHWAAAYYSVKGQHDLAIAACERAQELDPMSLNVNGDLAWYYYYARRYDEAVGQARRTMDFNAGANGMLLCVMQSRVLQGMDADAYAVLHERLAQPGASAEVVAELDDRFDNGGMKSVLTWLATRNAAALTPSTYLVATSYALAGKTDEALPWLERACENREGWAPWIAVDPAFDRLQPNERVTSMVSRMGL